MKALISAILFVSILGISGQAYDYATELAKGTACYNKIASVYSACTSDTTCVAAQTAYSNCIDSSTDAK